MEQMRNEINELIEQSKQKAKVLTEALPYIRRFNNCYVVVKYGGSAMKDKNLQKSVIRDVALLKLVGMKPIIVHGGGKEISKWVRMSGKEPEFYHGLRVTDKETMEVAEMVLFKVNQELVAMMAEVGVKAVGLSGKDAEMIRVKKKEMPGKDLGYVGEVKSVDTTLLEALIEDDFVPVISPIGLGDNYEPYNINADDTACAVAEALNAAAEERFLETGHPKDLTLFWVAGTGNKDGSHADHYAHEGMVKKVIGGHFNFVPKICEMLSENKIDRKSVV